MDDAVGVIHEGPPLKVVVELQRLVGGANTTDPALKSREVPWENLPDAAFALRR